MKHGIGGKSKMDVYYKIVCTYRPDHTGGSSSEAYANRASADFARFLASKNISARIMTHKRRIRSPIGPGHLGAIRVWDDWVPDEYSVLVPYADYKNALDYAYKDDSVRAHITTSFEEAIHIEEV
jgi:hypothetical protein